MLSLKIIEFEKSLLSVRVQRGREALHVESD